MAGCGLISSWFVQDLTRDRPDATTKHIVQAVGSSSKEKGTAFIVKNAPSSNPSIYSSYAEVYNDPEVDIVYIGTPHSCHLQNALDAINAGKNVLCEKPMTINAKEAKILINAAKSKGVFLMEGKFELSSFSTNANNSLQLSGQGFSPLSVHSKNLSTRIKRSEI
jgi:predicted dehydrogenase